MITLYLVRHVETMHNAEGITQGQTDSPLSAEGKKQARALAQTLKNIKIDKVYTSDLRRALATVDAVNKKRNIPVVSTPLLRERAKGEWEGVAKEEIIRKNPELVKLWAQEVDVRPPGGENFEDLSKRVIPLVNTILKENDGKNILIVSHGNVNRVIIGHFLNIPFGVQYRLGQSHGRLSKIMVQQSTERVKCEVKYINLLCE